MMLTELVRNGSKKSERRNNHRRPRQEDKLKNITPEITGNMKNVYGRNEPKEKFTNGDNSICRGQKREETPGRPRKGEINPMKNEPYTILRTN